jgi:hypothetical protein
MKLLYCQECGDIIAPDAKALVTRRCRCHRHIVWWEDPERGIIRVCDSLGHPEVVKEMNGAPQGRPRAWLLGITNRLLFHPCPGPLSADEVERVIDAHENYYMFKTTRSLIVRFRPGQSSDSAWALPPDWEARYGANSPDKSSEKA